VSYPQASVKAQTAMARLDALVSSLAPLVGPANDQTINAAWANQVGNLAVTVPAGGGIYRVIGKIVGVQGTSAGGQAQTYGITGPAVSWARGTAFTDGLLNPVATTRYGNVLTVLGAINTAPYTTGQPFEANVDFNVQFSAGGTVALGAGNAGGVNWTVKQWQCRLVVVPASPVG